MALPPPKPARKRKLPERKKLNVGQFIASEKDSYRIESVLGSGGFGDVYKVVCVKDESKKYAMKTEYFDPRKRKLLNRLKVEMGVFTEILNAPPARKKHFIQMIDKGQTDLFKFIVMEIVSHSLEDIRKYMLAGKLSWQTAIKVASQTLIAISDLHSIGYIHRDIKPHNFAIGRPPLHSQIFMLDFGIARRFTEKDGKIRVPRERVTFLGTVKFASRQCHLEQEQSRKDDLEVWIYMVLELFEQENLIWRRQTDRTQILQLKERLFTHTDSLDLRTPNGFKKIIEIVKKLNFADEPDYAQLDLLLWECAKIEKMDLSQPFDWIDKVMPEKTKPKKKAPAARLENDDDPSDRRRREKREAKAKKKAEKEAKKDQPSEGKESKDGKKKSAEEEDDEEEEEEEESKDKKGSQGARGSGEGTGKHRKSMSRNTNKKSKHSKDSKEGKEVEVDPAKRASGEKFERDEKEKERGTLRHGTSKMKRLDAGASKMSRVSKRTETSDTPGSNKKSDNTDAKKDKKSDKHGESERRKGKSPGHSNRRKSGKRTPSGKEKHGGAKPQIGPAPSGPPPKNVSVMIQPQGADEANYVKSGYISIDMGPAGKK